MTDQQPQYPQPYQPPQQPPYPPQQYPQQYVQPYAGYAPVQVQPKNPAVALICSFFFPGLGSMVNGNVGMGILIFASFVFACLLIFLFIGLLLAPLVWLWGMIDAYHGAEKWNAAHGIIS